LVVSKRSVSMILTLTTMLSRSLKDNEAAIVEACRRDLGKPEFESYLGEVSWCMNDIIFVSNNLERWVKDEPAPDMTFTNKFMSPRIRKEPLGAVLIIG
jgi:beta-apo-4'-carotenal oxygenase